MNAPASRTSAKRSLSSGSSGPYCAAGLKRGIRGTGPSQFRGSLSPPQPVGDPGYRQHGEGEIHVFEVVMQPVVAPAERPPGAGEAEAPRNAAEEGERGEARGGHAEDSRRDGDERAHDRRAEAEQHCEGPETVEPALGAAESLGRR